MKNQSPSIHKRRGSTTSVTKRAVPIVLPAQCDAFELEIIQFVRGFTTNVSQSIAMNEVLFKNNLPQRCLKHNNVLTLYCEKQRIPLCVSCMYHGTQHKNHKVIPLKNASKNILTDTQNYANKVHRRIQEIDNIMRISTQNIVKIQKIYPQVCAKIQHGFKRMHQLLIKKQEEHIKQLYVLTQKLRSNHLVLIDELNKTSIKPDLADDEMNIYSRSILSTIIDYHQYIDIEVKPIEFNLYPQYGSGMFTDLQNLILEKLQVKKFPTIIILNHHNNDNQSFSKMGGETSEFLKSKNDESRISLSKSQHMPKFKLTDLSKGPPNFSPMSGRRSKKE